MDADVADRENGADGPARESAAADARRSTVPGPPSDPQNRCPAVDRIPDVTPTLATDRCDGSTSDGREMRAEPRTRIGGEGP